MYLVQFLVKLNPLWQRLHIMRGICGDDAHDTAQNLEPHIRDSVIYLLVALHPVSATWSYNETNSIPTTIAARRSRKYNQKTFFTVNVSLCDARLLYTNKVLVQER